LIRAEDPELGRDPDTGGQVKYVLELARALGQCDEVQSVELITRQIIDPRVGSDYARVEERLGEKAKLIRLPFGPRKYLRKEALWPYLEIFVDQCLMHFRRHGMPDIIHGHYADAGYAGAQLARLLHVPFVFTGHSLGRVKRERLLQQAAKQASPAVAVGAVTQGGSTDPAPTMSSSQATQTGLSQELERNYNFGTRSEAEEVALETASLVITSTSQEVLEQYEMYDHYQPERMEIIPPGIDLEAFYPGGDPSFTTPFAEQIKTFLQQPDKPAILAVARPDQRKNFDMLVRVYGQSPRLQALANLILVMGRRDDLRTLAPDQRRVLLDILTLIDVHNLYGKVAYPKTHGPRDIPALYRWAAQHRGVFINPALTEPFGLTVLEAAACGLPVVATNDGGPQDIIGNCQNGLLVDPLDPVAIEHALLRMLTEPDSWQQWAESGVAGIRQHYSWTAHVSQYLRHVNEIRSAASQPVLAQRRAPRRLPDFDRLIICDLDNTLDGDESALQEFVDMLDHAGRDVGFAIATGRRLDDVMTWLNEHSLPMPDVISTAVGTELYYGKDLQPDQPWRRQIADGWQPLEIRQLLDPIPGLQPQAEHEQTEFKISYFVDTKVAPTLASLRRQLRAAGLRVKLVFSLGMFLDVIPIRGGSELAIRHLMYRWGFEPEQLLIAGDSGNDEGMLKGRTLGVVVGNHSPELGKLKGLPRIYFASATHARGILEGIEYYNFLGHVRIPNDPVQ
jgi:sucrose-phosphate synthase